MKGVPFRLPPKARDLAALTSDAYLDAPADRHPDLAGVARAGADITASHCIGRFAETSAACILPAVEYEVDDDCLTWRESARRAGAPAIGRLFGGARRRYNVDHAARLRTLILHG
jgi:hypothetical protein